MTLEPDTLTIVAQFEADTDEKTLERIKQLIRMETDQGWVTGKDRGAVWSDQIDPSWRTRGVWQANNERKDAFDFKALPALHCGAFVVLPGCTKRNFVRFWTERKLKPCLIFEATFDGPREDFLRDLVDTNGRHLCEIFEQCIGFPKHAKDQPDLLVDFLRRRSLGYNAYFSGVPGRSISEIRSESDLRNFLSEELNSTFYSVDGNGKAGPRPNARFRDIQRKLRNLVRRRDELNLTEERPSDPASIRWGGLITRLTGGGILAAFTLMAWCLLSLWCIGWGELWTWSEAHLVGASQPRFGWIIVLAFGWVALRFLQHFLAPETQRRVERGRFYLMTEPMRLAMLALKLTIIALAIGLAIENARTRNQIDGLSVGQQIAFWLVVSATSLLLLQMAARWRFRPLRDAENGPHVSFEMHAIRAKNLMHVDMCNMLRLLCLLVLYVPALKAFDLLVPCIAGFKLMAIFEYVLVTASVLAILVLLGFALFLIAKNAILFAAHALQQIEDRFWFDTPDKLSERVHTSGEVWAREEHRTHLNQNHFASATLVKSLPRMLLLRLSLTLINFVARYLDNKGKLGGIPTIFSARWVLLDGGHRLVFLTNYVGAWDSYLGEFSDLNAYIGVNAIWTNTYLPPENAPEVKLRKGCRGIGFPTSSLLLFGGAAHEHPFKAYVRQSQIETLAWYGAYPQMSVPNINDNSRIRKDLFRTLSTDELDALFRRI